MKQVELFVSIIRKSAISIITVAFVVSAPSLARPEEVPEWTLRQCLRMAFQNNPHLQSSKFGIMENEARIREARAKYYPWLNIGASAGRYSNAETPDGAGSASRESYQAGIYASYTLFEGFGREAENDAAKAALEASRARYTQISSDLARDVTEIYYRLLQSRRMVTVAQKSLERAEVLLDYARARFENGLASRSDILKTKVERSNSDLTLIRARNSLLAASGHLNTLLGRPANKLIRIKDDMESGMLDLTLDSLSVRADVEDLINTAYKSRPELRELNQQMKAQRAAIRMARSDYFPTIALDGNYTYNGESASDLNGTSYIGLSLSVPLFSGFARPARSEQESWELRVLEKVGQSLQNQISLEVWEAYLAVKEAYERNMSNRIYYGNAVENLRIAEGEYREGVGSMPEVIDAETALVSAEENYVEALADFQISLAELKRAVGSDDIEEIIQ